MIRDIQEDDIDFYVVDELEKRILINNYHPIFKLQVSQLIDEEPETESDEVKENTISIITDNIVSAGIEETITINVEDFGGTKYRKINDEYIELSTIKGYYNGNKFFSDYTYKNPILDTGNDLIFIDVDTQKQYILINNSFEEVEEFVPGILENNIFNPFFTNYNDYPDIEPTLITPEEETGNGLDLREEYYSDQIYGNKTIFITYDNVIQLAIMDINNTTLHTAKFPHLAYGSIEYKCIFTTPGLYILKVTLTKNGEDIKEQYFNITVVEEDEVPEFIEINNIDEDDDESESSYFPSKIGNQLLNPRINQPTNLKCSLNSLILNNYYIKDLLNSNRSNILFTSPTDKDYQIYKYESHNIYNNNGELEDTWFFINANFIDEYIELHILPTYVNAMDNIILLSDNDIIDYILGQQEIEDETETESIQSYVFNNNEIESEYKLETINEEKIVFANVPVCSGVQWFDMTSFLLDENYKVSFDCYSSYYYRSVFYINNLIIYGENNNVYIEYNDLVDIIPYDLLCKGEHNIEFSIEDGRVALGIDDYIISTDILEEIDSPSELQIGFQQTQLGSQVTEALAIDDIDSYTYITNLIYQNIVDDEITDVTIKNIDSQMVENMPLKFPLNIVRNLSKLEIDVVRKGLGSTIIGVVDTTNPEPFDRTTLLDYSKHENGTNTHSPIQYKDDEDEIESLGSSLYIEGINEDNLQTIDDNQYEYNVDASIIQTLKYFNDDLYSESYVQQSNPSLSNLLSLFNNEQYYEQHWLDEMEYRGEFNG